MGVKNNETQIDNTLLESLETLLRTSKRRTKKHNSSFFFFFKCKSFSIEKRHSGLTTVTTFASSAAAWKQATWSFFPSSKKHTDKHTRGRLLCIQPPHSDPLSDLFLVAGQSPGAHNQPSNKKIIAT